MNSFLTSLIDVFYAMKLNAWPAFMAIAVLWIIQLLNIISGYRLNILGLHPRRIQGIPGIFVSPFLHGSFTHLFFNSLPLFVLLDFMLMSGLSTTIHITIFIIILSGFLLWLIGRKGVHIGASGLIMGYLSYLLINAYHAPSVKSIILGIICLYYFGGLLLSVFPKEERVSWEGHFLGFLAGIAAVFFAK